jgi:hypothetical protein
LIILFCSSIIFFHVSNDNEIIWYQLLHKVWQEEWKEGKKMLPPVYK